jgi:hypothetical protein
MKSPLAVSVALLLLASALGAAPLSLHPENPRYFLFRDKPTLLITSGEHYGAVLNLDFNFDRYLETLQADGLNLTRVFSGAYVEPQGAFNIESNTLAPKAGRFIAPWARSDQPGYANGGNKFDLNRWDDAYFKRLKDFIRKANECGVIVEMNLFCPMYEDKQWALSPMNAANNVNGIGSVGKHDIHDLSKNGSLQGVQEKLVRKIVAELADFDNLYYEICNEPYFGGVTNEWQGRIADVIADAEKDLPKTHLISENVANGSKKITDPHPKVSIFNFHYAHPPKAIAENWELNKPIGLNETGFKGNGDDFYRTEAWEFMLAGGALYNNLDYSFTVGHEDGTYKYPPKTPGGGNPIFRRQIRVLAEFLGGLDFIHLKPARELIKTAIPDKSSAQLLAQPGILYAGYFKGIPKDVGLEMQPGRYRAVIINAISGKEVRTEEFQHDGGVRAIAVPSEASEFAISIRVTRD